MACSNPIAGWFSQKKNPTGKRSIVFNIKEGYVDMPVQIPCGKCITCKADQALMWSVRAYHESTLHRENCFITLTYDDANLPPDGKIQKEELQLFFKRLRKKIHPLKIRYIACGEYGEQTRRPHYHAIIFGTDFLHDKDPINENLYTSATLASCWGHGLVSIAPVNLATIMYVCGYANKKLADPDTFSLMSRRPGIGKDWLATYSGDISRTGKCIINGTELPVPARYLQWNEEEFAHIKREAKRYALAQEKKYDPVTRQRRTDAKLANRKANLQRKKETI